MHFPNLLKVTYTLFIVLKLNQKHLLKQKNVQKHTVEGPHPVANHSLHIQKIDPIRSVNDCIWTLTAYDAIAIGTLLFQRAYPQ